MTIKTITLALTTAALLGTAGSALARDIDAQEAEQLVSAGTIKPLAELDRVATALHSGTFIDDAELDEEGGRLIYEVELRNEAGAEWDVELDARTGEVLRDVQDD